MSCALVFSVNELSLLIKGRCHVAKFFILKLHYALKAIGYWDVVLR